MVVAERRATQARGEQDVTVRDTPAHRPGPVHRARPRRLPVGRHDLRRPAAGPRPGGRHPAVVLPVGPGADRRPGCCELKDASASGVGGGTIGLSAVVSFVVAYASIAFLLRFVASHSITAFVPYRVALGVVVLVVLGVQAAT